MSRLPRQVKLFGAVSLLNDFASEMIYPLLPAFVTSVLGAGPAALGALDGASEFAAAFVKYGSGRVADLSRGRGRGLLVVAGYFVAVVVRPVISLAGAAWQVVALRITDRIGKGIRTPPRDAMIADATDPALRGRAFGLQRGLDHAGAVLGPLIAWALLTTKTTDVRGVIAASVVPGIAVLLLAVWAVRDGQRRSGTVDGVPPLGPTSTAVDRPRQAGALLAIALFYLIRMPETLVLLHAQRLGVPVAVVTLLWAAVHVVKSLTSFVAGHLSDRSGPGRSLWLGWGCYALGAAGFAWAHGAVQAWLLFLVLGVAAGLTESPERALVSAAAGTNQGRGFGAYHAVTGLAALVGGLALGGAFQHWGPVPAFGVSAAGGAVLVLGWPFVARAGSLRTPE